MGKRLAALIPAVLGLACGARQPVRGTSQCGPPLGADSGDRAAQLIQTTHWSSVRQLAFSPSTRLLASSGRDGTLRIWDVGRRQLLRVFPFAGQDVGLHWDGEERLLVSRRGSPPVIIDVFTGEAIAQLGHHVVAAPHPARDGDTRWLGVGRLQDGDFTDTVVASYGADGNKIETLFGVCNDSNLGAFSRDGRAYYDACRGGKAQLWFAPRGVRFERRNIHVPAGSRALAVDARGRFVVWSYLIRDDDLRNVRWADRPSRIVVSRATGAEELPAPDERGLPDLVELSPEGDYLVGALRHRKTPDEIVAWRLEDASIAWTRDGSATAFAVSPDGRRVAIGWDTGAIELVDLRTGQSIAELGARVIRPREVRFDGDELVIVSSHQETRWSLRQPEQTARRHLTRQEVEAREQDWKKRGASPAPRVITPRAGAPIPSVSAVATHAPTGQRLAGTSDGDLVVLRDEVVDSRGGSDGLAIRTIVPSPDGRLAATISLDGIVRLWDTRTGLVRALYIDFADEEWMVATPGGAYAGTPEVGTRIGWVFDDPLEFYTFEQFAEAFHDPALVRRRLRGERVAVDLRIARPPGVRIHSFTRHGRGGVGRLTVETASQRRTDIVRAYVEGRLAATAEVCAHAGTVELEVPLVAGVNRVTVVAFDDRGYASNYASVDIVGERSGDRRPALWVVAVGVSSYPDLLSDAALAPAPRRRRLQRMQLPAARRDAEAVSRALAGLAGDGGRYSRVHAVTLTDADATPRAIRSALSRLRDMQADDLAIVLFAGHGMKPAPGAEMVFVTGGARLDADGRSLSRESLRDHVVTWRDVAAALSRARGRVMVLLDACHAGHISRELVTPNDALADRLVREGRAGAIVFAAAKGRQLSYEPGTARALTVEASSAGDLASGSHGFFTAALLHGLSDPLTDRDGDGSIQASELIEEVTRRVVAATGGRQTPWVARRDLFGDFRVRPTPNRAGATAPD